MWERAEGGLVGSQSRATAADVGKPVTTAQCPVLGRRAHAAGTDALRPPKSALVASCGSPPIRPHPDVAAPLRLVLAVRCIVAVAVGMLAECSDLVLSLFLVAACSPAQSDVPGAIEGPTPRRGQRGSAVDEPGILHRFDGPLFANAQLLPTISKE
jgi:hypothetical protein